MRAVRAWALLGLLALFLYSAWVDQHPGRLDRLPPHRQVIRPATPQEAQGADLTRDLEQWRTQLNGAQQ